VPVRYRHRPGAAHAGAQGGMLALGCFHTFAPSVVPPLVARVIAARPGLSVTLVDGGQGKVIDSLRRGDIEVALLFDFGLSAEFHTEVLEEQLPYVLLPANHPLVGESVIELRDLVDDALILLDVEPSGEYFLSLFRAHGLEPQIAYRTTSLEMVRGFVGEGLGYSLLATKPAGDVAHDGRPLVTRPVAGAPQPSRLVLAHLARRELSPSAQAFAAECRAHFRGAHG